MLQKVGTLDEKQLVTLLGGWQREAESPGAVEEAAKASAGLVANRIQDHRNKIGLVNVSTYDNVGVMTEDAVLGRHLAPATTAHKRDAVNETDLKGWEIGLVNVTSIDQVAVVPNLAAMIFGGSSLEKAAQQQGL